MKSTNDVLQYGYDAVEVSCWDEAATQASTASVGGRAERGGAATVVSPQYHHNTRPSTTPTTH